MSKTVPIILTLPLALLIGGLGWQLISPGPARHNALVVSVPRYTFLYARAGASFYLFEQQDAQLGRLIEARLASASGSFSVAVRNLTTGQTAGVDETRELPAASLYKIPVMIAWMQKAKEEGFDLDETTSEQVYRMITISDNSDGQWLGAQIGWENVSIRMSKLGFDRTVLSDPPVTTAADLADILTAIYNQELIDSHWSQEMFRILKDQRINDRIPRFLPPDTVVAHKTGEIDNYRHDVGIVEAPRSTYVIVFLGADLPNPEEAKETMALLSRDVYDYFEQQFDRPSSRIL